MDWYEIPEVNLDKKNAFALRILKFDFFFIKR